jgi:hypothetical protein
MAIGRIGTLVKLSFGGRGRQRAKLARLLEEYGNDVEAIRGDLDCLARGLASMATAEPVGNGGVGAPASATPVPQPGELSTGPEQGEVKRRRGHGRSPEPAQTVPAGAA